jgi:hypothetical protein
MVAYLDDGPQRNEDALKTSNAIIKRMLTGIFEMPLRRILNGRCPFVLYLRCHSACTFHNDLYEAYISIIFPNSAFKIWQRNERSKIGGSPAINGLMQIGAYDDKTQIKNNVAPTGEDLQGRRSPRNYQHKSKGKRKDPVSFMNAPRFWNP